MDNTEARPSHTSLWPLPWWMVLSLLALAGVLGALLWAGVMLAHRPPLPAQLPTPVLIVLSSEASPPPEPAAQETPIAQKQFKAGDRVRVTGTGGLDLRVRAGPGTLYETTRLVPEGIQLEITGEPRQADNYVWWPVRDPSDDMRGWVVSDYLADSAP